MANFPNYIIDVCTPTTPPAPDPRCSDPSFSILHPEICANSQALRIKPGVLLACILGSVQFRLFTVQNSIETEITSGITWTSSDRDIALVGVASGNATGTGSGTATITASYNGMTATAQLTILPGFNCCENLPVNTMLLVDKSVSMSQIFGSGYATKLDLAKTVAAGYAGQTNVTKDTVGLVEFETTATLDESPTDDKAAVVASVNAIIQTQELTGIGDALQAGVDALGTMTGQRVIVLISDGVDKGTTDPVPIVQSFKDNGGILICVGVRAAAAGFDLLNALSTGGFFVNIYPSIVAEAIQSVYDLKGYTCAGQCIPAGDEVVSEPKLDFANFLNWDVTGHVDLLGPGLFDVLPGNGMYVSMASNLTPYSGKLTSKSTFNFETGKTYRISFDIAGNQRQDLGTQTVSIKVGDGTAFSQNVTVVSYAQGFTRYSFNFVMTGDLTDTINFEEVGNGSAGNYYGCLLGLILLEDVTDGTTLFTDDFDNDNLVYIPPACGPSELPGYLGYVGYYCYGYGCSSEPPGTQLQDPNSQPDIEAGFVPPTTYSSTQSYTAKCPAGTAQVGPTSSVPVMTSATAPSGIVTDSSELTGYEGWRAFGTGSAWRTASPSPDALDYLVYQFTSARTIVAFGVTPEESMVGNVLIMELQGSNDGVAWTNLLAQINRFPLTTTDRIVQPVVLPASFLYYRLTSQSLSNGNNPNLGAQIALLELFEANPGGSGITKTATETSTVSLQDAIQKAVAAAQLLAYTALGETGCATVFTSTQTYTARCPAGEYDGQGGNGVTRSGSATSYVSQADADAAALVIATTTANAALNCENSNNTARIDIPDLAVAIPYPSVFFSEDTTPITRIRVGLIGLTHQQEGDVAIMLRAPTGKCVALCWNAGGANACANVDLTFDSASATLLPANAVFTNGNYEPTQYSGPMPNMLFPAPVGPYLTTFATLIGDSPAGAWSLWVRDTTALDSGFIASGWTLTIN